MMIMTIGEFINVDQREISKINKHTAIIINNLSVLLE